jgi:uncharacterized protein
MTTPDVLHELRPVAVGLFSTSPPQLIGGRCRHCGALQFPRRELCPECQRDEVEPVALSQTGTVYTFTIVRMVPPGYLGEAPYAYGVVELPEGLRVTTTLLADDLEHIAIGDRCDFTLLELGPREDRVLSYAYRIGDPR